MATSFLWCFHCGQRVIGVDVDDEELLRALHELHCPEVLSDREIEGAL